MAHAHHHQLEFGGAGHHHHGMPMAGKWTRAQFARVVMPSALCLLLFVSFVRGAFTSPGLVERGWYRRYPVLHEELRVKFKKQKEAALRQEAMIKRYNRRQQQ